MALDIEIGRLFRNLEDDRRDAFARLCEGVSVLPCTKNRCRGVSLLGNLEREDRRTTDGAEDTRAIFMNAANLSIISPLQAHIHRA
ncbi:MAG: hypothetical protein ACI4TC_01530, partial [Kiritimatiellia bacterium]